MIPVSTLYDEYIDRQKLSEQKETHLSIYFLPPQEGSEQIYVLTKLLRRCNLMFRIKVDFLKSGHPLLFLILMQSSKSNGFFIGPIFLITKQFLVLNTFFANFLLCFFLLCFVFHDQIAQ